MKPIRILHISDLLLAGDTPSRSGGNQSDLILKSIVDRFNHENIDYLVICGNITKDGSPDAYQLATRQLVAAAQAILGPNHGADLANRIVIVPGECELANGAESLQKFSEFVNQVRAGLAGNDASQLRQYSQEPVHFLKDFTLIVVPHWPSEGPGSNISDLILEAARNSQFEFCRLVPTILVSSTSPVEKRATGRTPATRPGTRVDGRFHIGLHFFGAFRTIVMTPTPFIDRHIRIATGPRKRQQSLPLRLNIVELVAEHSTPGPHERTEKIFFERRFSLRSYALHRHDQHWSEDSWLGGGPVTLVRHTMADQDLLDVHRSLRQELLSWING